MPDPTHPSDPTPPPERALPLEYYTPPPPNRTRWIIPTLSILAVAFIIFAGIAMLLPTLSASPERGKRVRCATNLRIIGQGLLLYANDNKGLYPRTRYNPNGQVNWFSGASDKHPFQGSGVKDNDVTAALFLLVRNADINPEVFICPTTNHVKDSLNKLPPDQRSNFTGPNNLSYSYTNPYPRDNPNDPKAPVQLGYQLEGNINGTFAIAADRNDGQLKGNTRINSSNPGSDHKKLNSRNHEGDGQNVLFNDGHVEWSTTPFIGANNDMIYGIAVTDGGTPPAQRAPAVFNDIGHDPQLDLDTILLPRKGEGF